MASNKRVFMKPVLRGERFDQHSLPVEVLPELSAYYGLVVDVAKHLFLEKHKARQRVPKGFVESFSLHLTAIEEGSAVPVLAREPPSDLPLLPDEFDEARDLIEKLIDEVGNGRPPPPQFPRGLLPRFNAFGRRLRGGESIELVGPHKTSGAVYKPETRKKLVLLERDTYSSDCTVVGAIVEAGVEKGSFEVRLEDGRLVKAVLGTAYEDDVLLGLRHHQTMQIAIEGTGIFDRDDVLQEFERVFRVTPVDDPVQSRFEALSAIEAGWLDGSGDALDESGLRWARDLMTAIVAHHAVPAPSLYPTPEGNVRAEWSAPPWDVEATFNLSARKVVLSAIHLETDDEEEITVPAKPKKTEADVAAFLGRFLRKHDG